ncbi:MAG TPA: cupin domain-containing protein [Acidimicrobiales bacterium]|nr:cupin domain-containing protein [Acidimicrobiales bacterium]
MHVSRGSTAGSTPHPHFSAPVRSSRLAAAAPPHEVDVAEVRCEPRAMSDYHRHPGGQILYVIAGRMLAAGSEDQFALQAGDVLVTEPGEAHRHGAAEDSGVRLLAMTWGGTEWE